MSHDVAPSVEDTVHPTGEDNAAANGSGEVGQVAAPADEFELSSGRAPRGAASDRTTGRADGEALTNGHGPAADVSAGRGPAAGALSGTAVPAGTRSGAVPSPASTANPTGRAANGTG
ncbi:hypothetical protein AAFH96_33400, partial [Polymorphospora sp. 2-325]